MSAVSVKITIDAPPERVWATIMDPAKWGDWVTIHRSAELRTRSPEEPGALLDQVLHMRGVSFKVHWTLDSVKRPLRAHWIGRGPALSKASITYRLNGPPAGPTVFEYTNEFQAPGGPLGAVASRVIIGSEPQREAQQSLLRLKALLEQSSH